MEERANILRDMKICRFCLDEEGPFSNIYDRNTKEGKLAIPLPLQIMACIAIEVFQNDGMPQLICNKCRVHTAQAYTFKTTCKKSDDALKLFLATGDLDALKQAPKDVTKLTVARKRKFDELESTEVQNTEKIKNESDSNLNSSQKSNVGEVSKAEIVVSYEDDEFDEPQLIEMEVEDVTQTSTITDEGEVNQQIEEEEEDDDKVNPVLRVPQVKTDVFPCTYCERTFPLKQLLELHIKNHTRERCYECDQCNRRFFTKYDLGKHLQTHSEDRPFSCVICQKQFARESLLHRHEKTHVDVPKYLCTYCERTFLTRADLDAHAEKHKKKRPYNCRTCNKSFVFKQGLERHEMTHSEERPHKCNYCEASFTSPIKLMRHITSHAGLRPYPCKLCGRTFLLSHHLTRHMRSHYASKNSELGPIGQHKCDICSMSFRRKDSLINHTTIHSMVNLKCVICNTAFDNTKQVMNHITTHLSGLPYPCDKCDYSFDTQDQLEEHEIKHAEMEYEEQIEQELSQEARSAEEEQEEEDSCDEVTEYTITNPDNPEVVRRSKRQTKIKNYAEFLKEELGSDLEDELVQDAPEESHEQLEESSEHQSIKPIVRIEGTKVYTRKNALEKPKVVSDISSVEPPTQATEEISRSISSTIEDLGLTKQAFQALPHRQYVDMKIGDKTVRVQKLIMSKAEIEAMAKEGKIEMKGDTILLKKSETITSSGKSSAGNVDGLLERDIMNVKTYVKKLP